MSVFSLDGVYSPALGCIPKQPDSEDTQRRGREGRTGLTPSLGEAPDQGDLDARVRAPKAVLYTTVPAVRRGGGFGAGRFPLRSPLLRES